MTPSRRLTSSTAYQCRVSAEGLQVFCVMYTYEKNHREGKNNDKMRYSCFSGGAPNNASLVSLTSPTQNWHCKEKIALPTLRCKGRPATQYSNYVVPDLYETIRYFTLCAINLRCGYLPLVPLPGTKLLLFYYKFHISPLFLPHDNIRKTLPMPVSLNLLNLREA